MSKIARVFHLNKEIQKIYKNGVLQKLFFDWKKYIGEEINIEYARGYCSNRININGKVYQNLFDMKNLTYNYYDTFTDDGYKNINIPELSTGYKVCKSAVNNLIKANTVYTIIIDVRKNTFNKNFGINSDYNNEGYFSKNIAIQQKFTGRMVVTATSKETLPSSGQKVFRTQITPDSLGEIEFKLMLLEGDLSSENITEYNIKYLEEGTFIPENKVIAGKTYQNLVTNSDELTGKICTTSEYASVSLDLFKTGTIYTLVSTISESNYSSTKFGALLVIKYSTINDSYIPISLVNGTFKIKFTTGTEKPTNIRLQVHGANDTTSFFKLDNLIILEGDYTNIDLPKSINGIESVGEGESVKSKNLCPYLEDGGLNDKGEESPYTDSVRSPFIYLNAGNYVTSNNKEFRPTNICIYDLNKKFKNRLLSVNTFSLTENVYVRLNGIKVNRDKFQLELGNTPTEYEPFYEYYPVTIRNYNYKCETDGILLPNGVKNTIEEVNGVMNYVQRVGKIIIDGTQEMTLNNVNQTQTSRILFAINNAKYSSGNNNLLCNWYIRNGDHGDFEYIIIQYSEAKKSTALFISVLNNKLETSDLNGIKKYFKENPLTVYYELESPIFISLYDSKEMIDTPMLPNGVQNELILTDSGFKKVKKTNTTILNGTENWALRVTNDDFSVYNCDKLNIPKTSTDYGRSSLKMLCEQFAPSNISSTDSTEITKEGICLRQSGTGFILSISNSKLNTQNLYGFKSYLQSNPVTVTYELDTQNIVDTNLSYPFENDTFGITLPLGQKDTIDGCYITKRVWKLTVDNTTTFNFPTSLVKDNTVLISIPVTSITKLYDATVSAICDTLEFKNIYDLDETGFYINKAGNTLYIRLPISDYGSTLSEVTEKLKTNKIVIYYPLLNEIKIPYINKININQPLRSLPNGVCDTIEENKLVQRVGKVVLDGNEDWIFQSCDTNGNGILNIYFIIQDLKVKEKQFIICDKYIQQNTTIANTTNEGVLVNREKRLYLRLFTSKATTVEEAKEYIKNNPFVVYYELETPIETELNLPTITIKEGTNFITTTNNIKPNIQAECLVRCNETNMLNVKEFVGDANVIIDKIKVEKGTTYLFTFTNNLGENDVNNTPNIIATDKNISIISNTHNTLYGATVGVNLGVAYTYKNGYQFTSNYDYIYITSCNANTTSKNLSNMCLKRV